MSDILIFFNFAIRPTLPLSPSIQVAVTLLIMKAQQVNIKNKKAHFNYEIGETFTAGMVLTGTEIKSIRDGKASLTDSYCIVDNGEVWVKGMHISEYFYGSYNNHSVKRDRKLLLNKKEILKITKAANEPGFTIVPIRIFINEKGYAKLVIGIGKGKKQYDKRQSIKEREDKRNIDRFMKR